MYSVYCNNFDAALTRLQQLNGVAKWERFLQAQMQVLVGSYRCRYWSGRPSYAPRTLPNK